MKKILITGEHSYIGNAFADWARKWPERYEVDKISLRSNQWKEQTFSGYDAILHVAGIAHIKAKASQEDLYYRINCDLAIEIAEKVKQEGGKHFILLSSMSVYGESSAKNRNVIITKDTKPNPSSFYGKSKLQAEEGIRLLQEDQFKIAVIRPPMVYGKGATGNFPKLVKLAKLTPIFPNLENQRSMVYIDNLCELIRLVVENEENGVFHPQNREYVNTSKLVKMIAEVSGRRIWLTKLLNPLVRFMQGYSGTVNKIFGTFLYDKELSKYKKETYQITQFSSSIMVSLNESKEVG